MTPQQFTTWATAVFGKYLPAMQAEVEQWLSPRGRYFIAALREIALREHPSAYGKPPGVHELETWKIEAYQRGHTLEAIEASRRPRPALAAEVEEPFMSPEDVTRGLAELRAKLDQKGRGAA